MASYVDKLRQVTESYDETLGISPEEKARREAERRKKEEAAKKQPSLLDTVSGYFSGPSAAEQYSNSLVQYKKNVNAPKK